MIVQRRAFILGALAVAAAPAIVRAEGLMRIKPVVYGMDMATLPDFSAIVSLENYNGLGFDSIRIARIFGQVRVGDLITDSRHGVGLVTAVEYRMERVSP